MAKMELVVVSISVDLCRRYTDIVDKISVVE